MYCTRMHGPMVKYTTNVRRIVPMAQRAVAVSGALARRYPSASQRVVEALSVALVVVFRSDYTPIAAGALVAALVGVIWWRRRSDEPQPEPEPEWTPVDWFEDVCARAKVPVPLVKDHWPTKDGHAFYLLITEWVQREGRPMTVGAWLDFAPLLRDVAGMGCEYAAPMPDEKNGGFGTIEFRGIRLEPYEPDMPEDTGPTCQHRDCKVRPIVHLWLRDDPDPVEGWFCATHADIYEPQAIDAHDFAATCVDAEWWWPSTEHNAGRCGDAPSPDETPKEWTPPLEPLSPLGILHILDREGSEDAEAPAPSLPPPDPATRRPKGAEPGSKGGAMLDLLATAGGPLRRGTLADACGLSPGYVDKLLTAWADLGVVHRVGKLWVASPQYASTCTLHPCGREEDAGE